MSVPKGYKHSIEVRKQISAGMVACWAEGRRQWQRDTPHALQKLASQQRIRRRMLDGLGGKCTRCGFSDWRALQVDHVSGNGRADRLRANNRNAWLKYVLAHLDKYQLLCANCNWMKRYENSEHVAHTED